jgi:hypothetical protein
MFFNEIIMDSSSPQSSPVTSPSRRRRAGDSTDMSSSHDDSSSIRSRYRRERREIRPMEVMSVGSGDYDMVDFNNEEFHRLIPRNMTEMTTAGNVVT